MDERSLKELWKQSGKDVSENQVEKSLQALLHRINLYDKALIFSRKRKIILYRWLKVAGILLLPVLASCFTYYYSQRSISPQEIYVENVEYATLPGEIRELILPDGTSVSLNSGSILLVPEKFVGDKRSVYLIGEAYFNVAKDEAKPFVVNTSLIDVKALGTAFCITSYPLSNQVRTTLIEGKVLLSVPGSTVIEPVVLHPSEQSYYDPSMSEFSVSKVNVETYLSWKDGLLIFNETSFGEVVNRLQIQFGLRVICSDYLSDTRITAKFIHGESITDILDTLKEVVDFSYSKESHVIYIK